MDGRRKRSIKNTAAALLSEFLVIAVGMFFPRVLIACYGSPTNGLISSLQQFAQYFTLISTGLSGAIVFAMYAPLAKDDRTDVERLVASAGRVFFRMGVGYTLALVGFGLIYPLLAADTGYSYAEVLLMFIAIGINGASQLFYSGKYKALLTASQHSGIVTAINAVFTVAFSLILMLCALSGVHALVAVILASCAYILRAAAYGIAARRYFAGYDFSPKGNLCTFAMQGDVMLQQIFTLIVMNAPMIVMTVLGTDMAQISVFSVYNMVLSAIFVVSGAVNTGVSAGFGDLIVRGDGERLRKVYREYEVLFRVFWIIVSGCTAVMFLPFIRLYSAGITDTEYVRPTLCFLFAVLAALWMIRMQQGTIVAAAGKYREIRCHSIIEAVMAIVLCAVGLIFFGLEGMLLGKVITVAFRVISFTDFNVRYVIDGDGAFIWGHTVLSFGVVVAVGAAVWYVTDLFAIGSFVMWGVVAVASCAVFAAAAIGTEMLFNRDIMTKMLRGILKRR